MELQLFATSATGLEKPLAEELRSLGATRLRPGHAGVAFEGPFAVAMKVCLWSRVASRLLWPLTSVPAEDPDQLHAALLEVPWEEHLPEGATLAVNFVGTHGAFRHAHFGALKVKDAIVDRFRALGKERPSVNIQQPDVRIHVRLQETRARISLDLSGEGLHRRGWRISPSDASMKETLAAGLLRVAGWPEVARAGGAFVDPMCGAGTLPIEAAWMAANVAPGLTRTSFGFQRVPWFDATEWAHLCDEAREMAREGLQHLPPILAWDTRSGALTSARKNADAAGLGDHIQFEQRDVTQQHAMKGIPCGLVAVNPPYGVRQGGEEDDLLFLYQKLGDTLRTCFEGWHRAIFTPRTDLLRTMGLHPTQDYGFHNGPIPCRLWIHAPTPPSPIATASPDDAPTPFANRLKKNLKQLGGWARREQIECFRLYDADMPEYAVAIDLYGSWVHIQEYHAPKTIDPHNAKQRFSEVLLGIRQVLKTPRERLCIKVRKPQKKAAQYEKQDDKKRFLAVSEHGLKFLVNLEDYLDSGLFLDQRMVRQNIGQLAHGRRFLNLFAYTGSATVYAAEGGATETVSVDISQTYLTWAQRNLALNGHQPGARHQFIQEDVLPWMQRQKSVFDLIFLAPPTFSNSKRMAKDLDIMRDYGVLLAQCRTLLAPDGILIFLTHARRFRLDPDRIPANMTCTEITARTVPRDFRRKTAFHRAWEFRRT